MKGSCPLNGSTVGMAVALTAAVEEGGRELLEELLETCTEEELVPENGSLLRNSSSPVVGADEVAED